MQVPPTPQSFLSSKQYHRKQPETLSSIQINLMSNIEQQLILSQFSYPKYYNGSDWNTVINKSRKSIPEYLHQDLPKLKFQMIREQFKKVEQVECPRLTYFNNQIIKQRMKHHCHRKNCNDQEQHKKCGLSEAQRQKQELDRIRSELQYALMTSKRESNVIRKLINKVSDLSDSSPKPKRRKARSTSMFKISQKNCFQNTIGMVLSARKAKLSDDPKIQEKNQRIDKRVESIEMLPFFE